MSQIKFQCANCHQHLESGEELRGQFIECPSCSVGFIVPGVLQSDSGAGKATPAKSLISARALLAFSALLVVGVMVIFAFLARAGTPRSVRAGERGSMPKNPAGLAGQHSPATARPSAIPPEVRAHPTETLLFGVPPEVRRTIQEQVGGGQITSIARLTEEGMTVFDVEITKDRVSRSFTVAADGGLLSFEVFESELPVAVKAVIERELGKVELANIERETDEGQDVYSMEAISDGHTNSLTVNERGGWWSRELELAQMPAPVQETIRRNWEDFEVTSARKTAQEGEVAYEFQAEKDGRQHSLTVGPDGQALLWQDEISLNQAPVPVQNTVKSRLGAGQLIRVAKAACRDAVSYDVTAIKDGKWLEFRVNPPSQ